MRLFGRQPTADQPAFGSEQQPAAWDLASTNVHNAACQADLGAQSVSWEPRLPSESDEHLVSTGGLQQLPSQAPTLHSHQAAQQCGLQRDEVAAAAQQIAYHAGAASLARQDAITLQDQVWRIYPLQKPLSSSGCRYGGNDSLSHCHTNPHDHS